MEFSVKVLSILFLFIASASLTIVEQQKGAREDGYDCGEAFFTKPMIQKALEKAFSENGQKYIRPYIGPLYSHEMNYMTWPMIWSGPIYSKVKVPLSKVWNGSDYQVVFDNSGNVIDMIVVVANKDFAKCWRVFSTQREAQTLEIEKAEGYYCGSRYIPKEHLKRSTGYAKEYLGKDEPYPADYNGHLYSQELGFLVWPIYIGKEFFQKPNRPPSPYFIVIDPTAQLKDVLVQTIHKSFIRCMISKNTPSPPSIDMQDNVIAMTPRSGFDCSGIFFDDENLQVAKNMARKSWQTNRQNVYPMLFMGPPFDSTTLIWPINPRGSTLTRGYSPTYRLVLDFNFNIICVAIMAQKKMIACERKTIPGGSLKHDRSDYLCGNIFFSNKELISSSEVACEKRFVYGKIYPKSYDEVTFEVPGPYLIYPIRKGKKFTSCPGNYRLVMNYECVVAGALQIDKTNGKLIKCDPVNSS